MANDTSEIHLRNNGYSMGPHTDTEDDVSMETWKVWASAFGFVTIINMSSVMGIIFFPLMNKSFYTIVMRTMIGLAIGSLSGSALFHLIPAAFRLDRLEHMEGGSDHLNIAFIIWFAVWVVMILECGIKIGVKLRNRSGSTKVRCEVMSKDYTTEQENSDEKKPLETIMANGGTSTKSSNTQLNQDEGQSSIHTSKSRELLPVYRSTLSLSKALTEMQSNIDPDENSQPERIKTVAWIVIIGDSLHNFIDGMSIGAAFVTSFRKGSAISLAVIFEEFPHELGDFAILINAGLTVRKALLFNFLSALTCYLGMALGIVLGETSWDNYIFAFAAGIFLYVALSDMVPEVTSLTDEVSDISPVRAIKVLLNHNLGILAGVVILYALAFYQP